MLLNLSMGEREASRLQLAGFVSAYAAIDFYESWRMMGRVVLRCVYGCTCKERTIDAHSSDTASVRSLEYVSLSTLAECILQIQVSSYRYRRLDSDCPVTSRLPSSHTCCSFWLLLLAALEPLTKLTKLSKLTKLTKLTKPTLRVSYVHPTPPYPILSLPSLAHLPLRHSSPRALTDPTPPGQ